MRTILGGLLLLGSVCSYATDTMTIKVDPSSSQFVVKLPSNPTTGYQWSIVKYDKQLLKMTNKSYLAPQTKLIGAGGVMTFTFALMKGKSYPKSTQLSFIYARGWESKSGTLKQVMVNFKK